MQEFIIKDEREKYLAESRYIDWKNSAVMEKAEYFRKKAADEISLVCMLYEFVRDEISHSWDAQEKAVTKSASEVLEKKTGLCFAKSNLLAALLRACKIPAGICYQRLTLGEVEDGKFCIHALNAVYIKELDKWIRLDARGNKEGVKAEFALEQEKLAFPVRRNLGEADYKIIYSKPLDKLMQVLEENTDVLYLYRNCLPDRVFDYKKAGADALEELVQTRLTVLRAANRLSETTDMTQVEKESYRYYKQALETGDHVAYLVYDEGQFIGAGGVSFYQVMPTFHNPDGRKAYIMNMYTAPEYRGRGIAGHTLELLVAEAKKRGIAQISLEATKMGRPLYQKHGFVQMESEMELKNG